MEYVWRPVLNEFHKGAGTSPKGLRMLLSIVFDKETCADCQSIIPNVLRKICNMLISQEFRKFRVINFAKRQVVADGHL